MPDVPLCLQPSRIRCLKELDLLIEALHSIRQEQADAHLDRVCRELDRSAIAGRLEQFYSTKGILCDCD